MFPKLEIPHMLAMRISGREMPYGLGYDVEHTPVTSLVHLQSSTVVDDLTPLWSYVGISLDYCLRVAVMSKLAHLQL